ncbi:hypothetical protein RB595_002128 [Gaeumannomyces hyphopodioides]
MPPRVQHIFPDWGVDVTGLEAYPEHMQPSNVMFNIMLDLEDLTRLREFEVSDAGAADEWWADGPYDAAADVRGTTALATRHLCLFRFGGADRDVEPVAFQADHPAVRQAVLEEVVQVHEYLRRVEYILERRGRGLEDDASRLPMWARGRGASRNPTWLLRCYLAEVRIVSRQVDHMAAVCRHIAGSRGGPGPALTLAEEADQWVTLMGDYYRKQQDKDDEFHYGFPGE